MQDAVLGFEVGLPLGRCRPAIGPLQACHGPLRATLHWYAIEMAGERNLTSALNGVQRIPSTVAPTSSPNPNLGWNVGSDFCREQTTASTSPPNNMLMFVFAEHLQSMGSTTWTWDAKKALMSAQVRVWMSARTADRRAACRDGGRFGKR